MAKNTNKSIRIGEAEAKWMNDKIIKTNNKNCEMGSHEHQEGK